MGQRESLKRIFYVDYELFHKAPNLFIADLRVTELTTVIYAANLSNPIPACCAELALLCNAVAISPADVA
jgi:hypothetical protein